MQLGGKPPKKGGNLFDEDFASGFEDSKLDKLKPVLKVLVVLVLIAGLVVGGVWAYGIGTNKEPEAVGSYNASEAIKEDDNDPTVDEAQEQADQEAPAPKDNSATSGSAVQKPTNSQSSSTAPSSRSSYDPNKCKGLENNYNGLKVASDNNYTNFNNAMNSAKNWGDLYEQNGRNKALTDIAYNEQQANIEALQQKWKDSLDDQNNAYDDFLKCRGSNN